ncbi:Hypothetical predicted protein [Mytilus galloprovincialis]|uniref:CCHC-type domain-containing protein n=1 Tax=Mytilus galloprovincialis TaxID=29158 RepID=A0A8B6FIB8_MYTGA|nr:Hypothetical predicted protein [Mytilus galloprovincialis]
MRLKIKQSRPINLDEAIRLAVELEAFNQAESSNRVNRGHLRSTNQSENIDSTDINSRAHTGAMEKIEMSMKTMEGMIKTLQNELEQMKSAGNSFDNKRWVTNNKRNKGCFNCGKLGHFQAECRSPSRRDTTRRLHTNRGQNHNAKSRVSIIEDAGMYVDTILNKRSCKFLVDTGATLSIVSFKLYESLPKHCKVELYETSQNITSANGGLLTLYGKGYFSIQIGKETFKFEALVADIKAEGILGLDFLKANKCVLDVVSERLFLGESEIQLIFEGPLGCYRVVSSETVSIPPSSEVVVNGKVCFPGGYNLNSFEGVIEPSENSAKNDGPLIARTLVKVNECVPVRLLNMKQDSQVVYQGSTIGQVHKIESVCENTHSDLKNKQSFELRSDLKALYEKACENLDEQHSDQLKVLIRKYEGLFAESDKELGHTNLVKHRINTGNAQPVKEPPRRAPVHLRQEVDKNIDDMLKKGVIEPSNSPWASVQSSFPMERIATDILGELPETKNGNKYILVVSDYFSKWTESFPMPNMEAETVVKLIVEEVITRLRDEATESENGREREPINDVCSTEGWGNMQNEKEIVPSDLGTKCLEESSHEPEKEKAL